MKIALFSFDTKESNCAENLFRVTEAVAEAARVGAQILVLPELWPSGYDLAAAHDECWEDAVEAIAALSAEHDIAIVGSALEPILPEEEHPANVAIAHEHGEEVSRYRKAHLFAPLAEDRFVAAGDDLPEPFELAGIRAATAICYDLRFPELFRPASVDGVDLWCIPAQWPASRIDQWRALLVARAIESQSYVVGVNRIGWMRSARGDSTLFGGNSLLVSPAGDILIDSGEEEGLFVGEIIPEAARGLREEFPVLADRRWDLY